MDLDIMELLAYLAKEKEPGVYDIDNEEDLESFLYDYYMIELDSFTNLIHDLLPLCDKAKSELTGNIYQGFGTDEVWLVNRRVN